MEAKEERETETAAPRSLFGVPIDNLVRDGLEEHP